MLHAASGEHQALAALRVARVFEYLKALHQHRNPVVRSIADYDWRLRLAELPEHADIERYEVAQDGTETPDLLVVRRPRLTDPPAPPLMLREWVEGNWAQPEASLRLRERRRRRQEEAGMKAPESSLGVDGHPEAPGEHSQPTRDPDHEYLTDDPERAASAAAWLEEWRDWARAEIPVRAVARMYDRLFELHQRFGREGERLELVLGEGLLEWPVASPPLRHPVLLQRAELTFDPSVPAFRVSAADRPTELYGALFQQAPVEPRVIADANDRVLAEAPHVLGAGETTMFLRQFAAELASDGRLLERDEPLPSGRGPTIRRDPILFVRQRSSGFGAFIDEALRTLQREGTSAYVPASMRRVVGVAPPRGPEAAADIKAWEEPADVLLSKAANPEQIRVARQLDRGLDVLVQGPPGTGKTHTIANLLGHLLAQGKSVLVTSHTTKALGVLREKVVPPLQPLCVSVLDDNRRSQEELQSSIQAIVTRLATSDLGMLKREAAQAEARRTDLLRRLNDAQLRLRRAREGEYRDVVVGSVGTPPADAGRTLAAGTGIHDWIPAPVETGSPLPLSELELDTLYRTNALVSPDQEREIALVLPPLDGFPPPDSYAELVEHSRELRDVVPTHLDGWSTPASADEIATIDALVSAAEAAARPLYEAVDWQLAVLDAGIRGGAVAIAWEELAAAIDSSARKASEAEASLMAHEVTLPPGAPAEHLALIEGVLRELPPGGRIGKLALLLKPSLRRFVEQVRTDGRVPRERSDFELLAVRAQLEVLRQDLAARWDRALSVHGAPRSETLGTAPERAAAMHLPVLRRLLHWHRNEWEPLATRLADAGLAWGRLLDERPHESGLFVDLERLRRAITEVLLPTLATRLQVCRFDEAERKLAAVSRVASDAGPTDVAERLRAAVAARDSNVYREAFDELADLTRRVEHAVTRRELLDRLRAVAPAWAAAVESRTAPHDAERLPGDVVAAWQYRQFAQELDARQKASLDAIQQEIERIQRDLRSVTAELIDRRAWCAQVERTTPEQQQALMGYRSTMHRLGARTGRRVPKLLAEARQLLSRCRDAVPVWIMPLSRAVESFAPGASRFDVVIVDEASQCDVMGLLAFYLADQVIVVGDDQQVSPDAVGQRVDAVQRLIDLHLHDIPNAFLYDGQVSVYELAQQSFPRTIRLVEHFRCVPDIIEFSNQLSYEGEIRALRDASAVTRRPHVVAHRVHDGLMDRDVNAAEATEVAALVAAMTELPEYADATIGVVCMQGDDQAQHIEKLLRRKIPEKVYAKHRILCGNAAQFQGDERSVMLLSVVASGRHGGPLPTRSEGPFGRYKKRFNVAASRAQDQMWVVHSLDPDTDLTPADLRLRLIRHAEDPQALLQRVRAVSVRAESEFERRVLEHLVREGYRVTPQVWAGSFRLDMVVQGANGQVAVECDGDRYHQDIEADMARQAILERVGWRFIRIRGSRFFAQPERTLAELKERLRSLGIEPADPESATPAQSTSALHETVVRRAAEIRRKWEGRPAEIPEIPEIPASIVGDGASPITADGAGPETEAIAELPTDDVRPVDTGAGDAPVGTDRPEIVVVESRQPIPVEDLDLPVRVLNCLILAGIRDLDGLLRRTESELLAIRGFGRQCLDDVQRCLGALGLSLGQPRATVLGTASRPDGIAAEPAVAPVLPVRAFLPSRTTTAADHLTELSDEQVPGISLLSGLLSVPMDEAVRRWRMQRSTVVCYVEALVSLYERMARGERVSILDEIGAAVAGDNAGDLEAAVHRFGLDGTGPETLEEAAQKLDVTRERVRQRMERFAQRVLGRRPPLPICETIAEIQQRSSGWTTLEAWLGAIPDVIRPGSRAELELLETVEQWHWLPECAWIRDAAGCRVASAGTPVQDAAGGAITTQARRAARLAERTGVAHDAALAAAAGWRVEEARAYLLEHPRWRAVDDGWHVVRGGGAVGRWARALVSTADGLTVRELRQALRRCAQRPGRRSIAVGTRFELPAGRIFRAILRRAGVVVYRATGEVTLRDGVSRREPSATDAAIVSAFDDRTVRTIHELDAHFEARGLSRHSARMAISYSPLLRRVGRSLYTRIGLAPAPDEIEQASQRLRAAGAVAILDHFTGHDGKVHVVYRVSPQLGRRGLPLPPDLVPVGQYRADATSASHRPIVVRPNRVTGLRRIAAAASRDAAERLALSFDLEAQRVSWLTRGPRSPSM